MRPIPLRSVVPLAVRLALCGGAVVLGGCATTPTPTTARGDPPGYVTDSAGKVVRASGQCVRTGFWNPSLAIPECDPQLVAQAPRPPPAQAEPTPPAAATAAPETPADTAQAAQAPAEPVRIYVGADAYFGFNQAQLTPAAQRSLDLVVERARRVEDASVRVVGHADEIGPEDYNLSLSQRRADAVRTYLIAQGLDEAAVTVEARGEADPIVRCEGRQGASLIQCLQPNRRTEIEFSGLQSPEESG